MSKVRVLVTSSFPAAMPASIADVDTRIDVTTFTDAQRSLLFSGKGDGYVSDLEAARSLISEAEVVFCGHEAVNSGQLFSHSPKLRWLHTITAGVDCHFLPLDEHGPASKH